MPGPSVPRSRLGYVAAPCSLLLAATLATAQQQVRVATYNIKFLKASIPDQRAADLKQVISRNTFELSATIQGQARMTITLPPGKVPLNNDGDQVSLINPDGGVADAVTYTASQVHAGKGISFP